MTLQRHHADHQREAGRPAPHHSQESHVVGITDRFLPKRRWPINRVTASPTRPLGNASNTSHGAGPYRTLERPGLRSHAGAWERSIGQRIEQYRGHGPLPQRAGLMAVGYAARTTCEGLLRGDGVAVRLYGCRADRNAPPSLTHADQTVLSIYRTFSRPLKCASCVHTSAPWARAVARMTLSASGSFQSLPIFAALSAR